MVLHSYGYTYSLWCCTTMAIPIMALPTIAMPTVAMPSVVAVPTVYLLRQGAGRVRRQPRGPGVRRKGPAGV